MPTRNINLTVQQEAFVQKAVRTGEYQNASEMIRAALAALQRSRREDALKLELLRAEVRRGIADLEAGNQTVVEDVQLESFIDGLMSVTPEVKVHKRGKAKAKAKIRAKAKAHAKRPALPAPAMGRAPKLARAKKSAKAPTSARAKQPARARQPARAKQPARQR